MKARPILMNSAMVRATLADIKTQTRRIVKPQPEMISDKCIAPWRGDPAALMALMSQSGRNCPYGKPGDRLYVRETFALSVIDPDGGPPEDDPENYDVIYRADDVPMGGWADGAGNEIPPPWKPSIHMPRWASRILLEITDVRVERLQDISEQDAIAEGIEQNWIGDPAVGPNGFGGQGWIPDCGWRNYMEDDDGDPAYTPEDSFQSLWQSINGSSSWDLNPWVWVVTFKKISNIETEQPEMMHSTIKNLIGATA